MTKNEFNALCGEFGIDCGIALECDAVVEALKNGGKYDDVKKALAENF
jgi:hypothetical protein